MPKNMKKRPLLSILLQIPVYTMVVGLISTICDIFYELYFLFKYPKFKYLFVIEGSDIDTDVEACYIPTPYYKILKS